MNKIQLSRWNAAKKLFEKLIQKAKLTASEIWYDGTIIKPEQIIISDKGISVKISNCFFEQFNTDPTWDEGLHTSKADYVKMIRANFKLVKYIRW